MANREFWIKRFKELGAYWMHDGNPHRPHALLTSGKHSTGFFNASKIICHPLDLENACLDTLIGFTCPSDGGFDWVIGSAYGAITIPHVIAKRYGAKAGFVEKVPCAITPWDALVTLVHAIVYKGLGKEYVFSGNTRLDLKRFDVKEGDNVLVVDDVFTTGKTLQRTIAVIESRNAVVHEKLIVIMNRSGQTHMDGREIVALIDQEMPMVESSMCATCVTGSDAIRPKGNWDILTAEY